MRGTDVAPKCAALREARRDRALAAADYFKIAGRNFEVEWNNYTGPTVSAPMMLSRLLREMSMRRRPLGHCFWRIITRGLAAWQNSSRK